MHKIIGKILLTTIIYFNFALAQNWEWAIGGKGYDSFDYSSDVAVDRFGNAYLLGYFKSKNLSFGSVSISNKGTDSEDFFIAKFNSSGTCLWAKAFGGDGNERGKALAVRDGSIFVCGFYEGDNTKFENINLPNSIGSDIFVAELDLDGNLKWVKTFYGDGYEEPNSLIYDSEGNLYICGDFSGEIVVFGTDTLKNFNYGSAFKGLTDAFLLKLNSKGEPLGAIRLGGVSNDRFNCLALDNSNNVYVAGSYNSNRLIFPTDTLINKGYSDVFVVRYRQIFTQGKVSFEKEWVREISGTDKEYPSFLTIDKDNYIYLVGEFQSSQLKILNNILPNFGSYDIFLIRLDLSGTIISAKSYGGNSDEYIKKIIFDKNHNIYFAGYFASESFYLEWLGTTNVTNTQYSDVFLAKFDFNGVPQWILSAGGNKEDQSFSIAVDNNGNVYQVGNFESKEIRFNKHNLFNFGHSNIFIAKANPLLTDVNEINSSSCLVLYPNPCTDYLFFSLPLESESKQVEITTLEGTQITVVPNTSFINRLDVSKLAQGVYLFRYENRTKLFVKM
ncbi:MAG: T9SS type A sorting domain-containing protein [Ignavibacteria bacterium]|nr:T9SS type A sorting domain-containing protein [Ignavibacteria bacterium]